MQEIVYFGSAHQEKNDHAETLPAKLDRILAHLRLEHRVKDKTVAIKMHLGGGIGYSTIHPLFIRKIVEAVKKGKGNPFVTDTPGAVQSAHERGYTHETLGCNLLPAAGPEEKHFRTVKLKYKNVKEWQVAGNLADADFLIDVAHVKGHPACGFGGVFKNLALGGMTWKTRSQIHDTCQVDRYWFKNKCRSKALRKKIIKSCPLDALVQDEKDFQGIHLHTEQCIQCMRCLNVAPEGSLKIQPSNFLSFQTACALSVKNVLSFFPKQNRVFIDFATYMTPMCDCFGFTSLPVLNDVGIFAGNDIVAVEKATLDKIAGQEVIRQNIPSCMPLTIRPGLHPFQVIHGPLKDPYFVVKEGERLGLGTSKYKLVDIMSLSEVPKKSEDYVSAKNL